MSRQSIQSFICLILFAFLSGCVSPSGIRIESETSSLNDIRAAVKSVLGDPRKISQNQREIYSPYFSPSADAKFDENKSKERAFSKVEIHGDRRPYDITIEVFIEEKQHSKYVIVDRDVRLATKFRDEIRKKLNESRDSRNVIDDFRAF